MAGRRGGVEMGRNLVLCFDGTKNQYAATNTNVVKIYAMLDREGNDQLSYYQPGIGTFAPPGVWGKLKRWWVTRLDLAIAWLLEDHVTDGYRFLMRYYQEGDRIFIFGFSRGAYTARAVAGMLYKVGLLTQGNEELLPFAWDVFKNIKNEELSEGFRHTFSRKVFVHFLGLWDTVSSVGWAWNPEHLPYTANNPNAEVVRHAVSLDERRTNFVQNLWGKNSPTDMQQVWFAGVHCDVGGGYAEREAGLSKLALKWMVAQAEIFGLRFNPKAKEIILPEQDTPVYATPNAIATQHESLQGWWWIIEFIPKSIRDPAAAFATRWIIPGGRHRYVTEGAHIHASVFERKAKLSSYDPPNLPKQSVRVG